jgi:hypothetical protein
MTGSPPDIRGGNDVIDWFGYWPTFHDAEVLSITLSRSLGARVEIHAFERTAEVDARGYFVLAKHSTVIFSLKGFALDSQGIANTRVDHFNHQNVLSGVGIDKVPGGYVLTLDGIFGVCASISCEHISVKLEPGFPSGR